MLKHEGFKILDMTQRIVGVDGLNIETLRCPIRVNGKIFKSEKAAPKVGQDNEKISGLKLAKHLYRYAATGKEYTASLEKSIKANSLDDFDEAKLLAPKSVKGVNL